MAKLFDLDDEWQTWVQSRPKCIQELASKIPPNLLYRLKSSNHRVFIYSYLENGTLIVVVSGQYNYIAFERRVFGINPDDLEECDLPREDVILGSADIDPEELHDFVMNAKQN